MFAPSSHPTGTRQGLTARRSLTARRDPRDVPRPSPGSEEAKPPPMQPLDSCRTPSCEYAKPRKPARKNTGHEMCDLAKERTQAPRVVETTDFTGRPSQEGLTGNHPGDSSMPFKKGEKVTWSSAANGSWKTKVGVVTSVIKDRRGEAKRYEVTVPPAEGSRASPKIYFPRTSALKSIE